MSDKANDIIAEPINLELLMSPGGIKLCIQCDKHFTSENDTNLCSIEPCMRDWIRELIRDRREG